MAGKSLFKLYDMIPVVYHTIQVGREGLQAGTSHMKNKPYLASCYSVVVRTFHSCVCVCVVLSNTIVFNLYIIYRKTAIILFISLL